MVQSPTINGAIRQIEVFISSPTDVLPEREIAERVIARLDGIWQAHVRLRAERWERKHYQATKGFQDVIGEMAAYDLVVGILWKRIGSPLPPDLFHRADGSAYESGTVFELESAIAASEAHGRPLVYLFRKTAAVTFAAESVEEDRRQHTGLLNWWQRTTRDAEGHFRRGFQEFAGLEDFEQSLETLLESYLRDAGLIPSGPAWDIKTRGAPYPGLLPYDGSFSAVFFGRSLAIAGALEELKAAAARDAPMIVVVGPSGSGKSSLARAGLMPYFAGTPIAGIDFWRQLLLEPAQDPILAFAQRLYAPGALPELAGGPQSTAEAFAKLARQSAEGAMQAINWGLERAGEAVRQKTGGGRQPIGRLLICLDQLETLLISPQRAALAGLVRALVENEIAWVIATLRSDRYGDLQLDPDFVELRRRSALYDLPPPGRSEIADIIKGPARSAGLVFEERDGVSLAKVIGAAVGGADALPLLQMTLAQLCSACDGQVLTFAAYEAIGGIDGAIAAHAEAVFATVSPAGQATLDALLRALVADIDSDGQLTIRTPDRASLTADAAAQELVEQMTEARLLVNAEGTVRIAHEALLRHWHRATASPALQPQAILLRRQIEPNFAVWRDTGLETDLLQPGTALAAAEAIIRAHPGAFPPDLDAFVRQSAEAAEARLHREARRARGRAYAASIVAVLLAALSVMIFRLYGEASHNFLLALLTKTDQLLVEEKPTRAQVVASALSQTSLADRLLAVAGQSDAKSDEAVRVRTVAEVTGPASSAPLRTLMRASPANAAAFSADGGRFAIGYADGRIVLDQSDGSGREARLLGHTGRIWAVKFSPDGKFLASVTSNEALLWDLERGEGKQLCDGGKTFTDIAYSPDGRYLAWSSRDGHVTVRDLRSGTSQSFAERQGASLAVDFSADGMLLASSGDDGSVVIRHTGDWRIQRTIRTGRSDLISLAIRPDGKRIATAGLAGPVDVWNIDANTPETAGSQIPAPADKRWKIRYAPDGALLALASWDGTVKFWDARTLQYRGTIDGNDQRVNDIAFVRNAARFLTADESGAVRLWDLTQLRPMFDDSIADRREVLVGRYSPDGSKFVAGGKDGQATLYGVDADGLLHRHCMVEHRNWVTSVGFSPDSKRVVSVGMSEAAAGEDGIRLWDSETCRQIGMPINAGNGVIRTVAYSPAGDRIAWATSTGAIWLADPGAGGQPRQLPQLHGAGVEEVDFSPDGKLLVSGGRDGKVLLWNLVTGKLERELRASGPAVFTVRFASNGGLIASGGVEDRLRVWDITRPAGSEKVAELPLIGGANRLAFDAAASRLAVGSDARYISIWSVGNWNKIFQLNTLVGVRSVFGFHPTRGDLAFDGENGLVRVLRKAARPDAGAASGMLQGMDVYFDRIPANMADDRKATVIRAASAVCPTTAR